MDFHLNTDNGTPLAVERRYAGGLRVGGADWHAALPEQSTTPCDGRAFRRLLRQVGLGYVPTLTEFLCACPYRCILYRVDGEAPPGAPLLDYRPEAYDRVPLPPAAAFIMLEPDPRMLDDIVALLWTYQSAAFLAAEKDLGERACRAVIRRLRHRVECGQ